MAIILASLSFFCEAAYAVPMTTNYQGFLRDTLDKPLTANVNLSFTLYDASVGGTALWTETQSNIAVQDGIFGVILGSNQPIPENVLQKALYLGVKVNTDPEMQPRQVITSSLFAMRAGVAETVVKGAITADSLTAGSVTMEKVADGAIDSSKLAASAVTGNNIATNAVTGDKITNGTITNDKLSADVQQKLEQSGQMPSSVATLNVTDKLKVGPSSINLDGTGSSTVPANSIYTSKGSGTLFVQSESGNDQNTVINNDNTGKVGIGTKYPAAKLHVNGPVILGGNGEASGENSIAIGDAKASGDHSTAIGVAIAGGAASTAIGVLVNVIGKNWLFGNLRGSHLTDKNNFNFNVL